MTIKRSAAFWGELVIAVVVIVVGVLVAWRTAGMPFL